MIRQEVTRLVDAQGWMFEPSFNRAVTVCASDHRITLDADEVLLREADHRLRLSVPRVVVPFWEVLVTGLDR